MYLQKPFLKWVGGKTQIIDAIINKFPKEINDYHEIFLGGGSVLFALLSFQKNNLIKINGKIYAYDLNDKLINVYKNVQNNKEKIFEKIMTYLEEYNSIQGDIINRNPLTIGEAKTSKESYYYWLRNIFNNSEKTTIESSALFILLNKLCFRGMYREGKNGFNVPYGHYKKTPTVITKKDLYYTSDLIKDVVFINCDFTVSMKNIKKGDFVYLDPPYVPENNTSFVGYNVEGFDKNKHITLFTEIQKLNEKNIKFCMSNSNTDLVTKYFKEYHIREIIARRAINSKKPQSTVVEVIINN